jgi:hypothetical protein
LKIIVDLDILATNAKPNLRFFMVEMHQQSEHPRAHVSLRLGLQAAFILCAIALLVLRPYLVKAVGLGRIAPEWLLVGPFLLLGLFITIVILEFSTKTSSVSDYLRALFGLLIIALLFPSSLREYRIRRIPDPMSIDLIEKFSQDKDANIRALAVLASARHNLRDPAVGALIHQALLDKDPLVQKAAKLVIEDNFGISLKSGAEGIHQAQLFITDAISSALLIRKGSP